MKIRYPSSRCFVRAWGNSTDALLETPITHVNIHGSYVQSKSRVVCVASKCIPGFAYSTSEDKCFGLTKIVNVLPTFASRQARSGELRIS